MSHVEIEEIGSTTAVSFVCEDCGRVHNRNNPPCNDCGSMRLSAAENAVDDREIDERESWRIVRDADREITGFDAFVYLVGTVTLLAGVSSLVFGDGWIVGCTLTAAGVMTIPAVRWRIESRLDVYLSSRTVLGLYLTLVGGGFALAAYL